MTVYATFEDMPDDIAHPDPSISLYAESPEDDIQIIVEFTETPLIQYHKELKDKKISDIKNLMKNKEANINKQQDKVKSQILKETNAKIKIKWKYTINGMAMTVKRKDIEKIKKIDGVKNVDLDYPIYAELQQSVPQVGTPTLWKDYTLQEKNITGTGIIVAVLDTGIDYNHPDIANCTNSTFLAGDCVRVPYGYDFVNNDDNPFDDNSHGTHCAGIIGANGNIMGMAPNVTFIAIKVLGSSGSGYTTDLISGAENATAYGVDVISMSIGSSGLWTGSMNTVMDSVEAANITWVVAAGNSGPNNYTLSSWATYDQAFAIGSATKDNTISSFSSRGYAINSNGSVLTWIKPDVLGIGSSINSTIPGGSYAVKSGTSMATPQVAGLVALIKQVHPTWTPREIRSAIALSANSLGYHVSNQGSGLINATASYNVSTTTTPYNIYMGTIINNTDTFTRKNFTKQITIKNMFDYPISYNISIDFPSTPGIIFNLTNTSMESVSSTATFNISVYVDSSVNTNNYESVIYINSSKGENLRVPVGMYIIKNPIGCLSSDLVVTNSTKTTTLKNMKCTVSDWSGNGVIRITNNNVLFDCNQSYFNSIGCGISRGIQVTAKKNVTIQNCAFSHFGYSIIAPDAVNFTIQNNNITTGSYGIYIYSNSRNTTIKNNNITDTNVGIFISALSTRGNHYIYNNSLSKIDVYGIYLNTNHNANYIVDNNLSTNARHIYLAYSNKTLISNNFITNSTYESINLFVSNNNTIQNNNLNNQNYLIHGVYIQQNVPNSNNVFRKNIIKNSQGYDYGIYSYPNYIYDSEINKIYVYPDDYNITLINSTYNYLGRGGIHLYRYLSIHAIDNSSYAVPGTTVNVYTNQTGSWVNLWSAITDNSGIINNKATIQYKRKNSVYTWYQLKINATKNSSYGTNTTYINNLTSNTEQTLILANYFEYPAITASLAKQFTLKTNYLTIRNGYFRIKV
jgi:subtilisin family serine protease